MGLSWKYHFIILLFLPKRIHVVWVSAAKIGLFDLAPLWEGIIGAHRMASKASKNVKWFSWLSKLDISIHKHSYSFPLLWSSLSSLDLRLHIYGEVEHEYTGSRPISRGMNTKQLCCLLCLFGLSWPPYLDKSWVSELKSWAPIDCHTSGVHHPTFSSSLQGPKWTSTTTLVRVDL